MLINAKTLNGYRLHSLDGEIGTAEEFYFDDQHWTVRYLVANTGTWLVGRKVLISPYALSGVDRNKHTIRVDLTKKQIDDSPSLFRDKPVSRQFEESYYGYYGWPMYWGGPYSWGPSPYIVRDREKWSSFARDGKPWDPHLRSTRDVTGHHVEASDGEIGHVEDFIVDDETWAIRYLIVSTRNWWPGRKVLVSPRWIDRVSWIESKVFTTLSRASIQQSPEYTEGALLNREFEDIMHRHYKRNGYWVDESDCAQADLVHR
jgi:hypothetical protein